MVRKFTMPATSPITVCKKMNILWPYLSCFKILCFVRISGLWFWQNILIWVHVCSRWNVIIWWIGVSFGTCTLLFLLRIGCSTSTLHFSIGIGPVLFCNVSTSGSDAGGRFMAWDVTWSSVLFSTLSSFSDNVGPLKLLEMSCSLHVSFQITLLFGTWWTSTDVLLWWLVAHFLCSLLQRPCRIDRVFTAYS